MTGTDIYLLQLDQAWNHAWESLSGVLDGVDEVEAEWQDEAYRGVEREADWPAPGTIAWQVAHLAHCKTDYARTLLHAIGRGPEPEVHRTPATSFAEELARLREAHREQRAAMASVTDDDLDRPVASGATIAEFLATTIRHDPWHAGQIALTRRLYREARGGRSRHEGEAAIDP